MEERSLVTATNQGFIDSYFAEMETIIRTISRQNIDRLVEILLGAWRNENTVFIMGNGGSASTATHFACDLSKVTAVEGKKRLRAISLNDNIPLMSAWINDNGFENLFSEQLNSLMRKGDVLIGISVHGGSGKDKAGPWSQNLLKAMLTAKEKFEGTTVGLSGFDGGAMKEMADLCVVVPFNSTPQVESFHVVLHHLVTFCLRDRLERMP
jgi:D-sedoheptulose 7-phosphate isomerase